MKSIVLATVLALTAATAGAHDDATLDKKKSPNGGQLRMAGAYHLELVLAKDGKEAKDSPVLVYLTDHADAKVPSAGTQATVTLLGGGQKATAVLAPDGDNRLKGMARYVAAGDLKAVVTFTAKDGKSEQARFTPFAGKAPAPEHKHH